MIITRKCISEVLFFFSKLNVDCVHVDLPHLSNLLPTLGDRGNMLI